jgi:hypothetical protein
VAGELAIYYALALDLRVYYTTPLKALSNQKFADFCRQFGPERVGLLTGDTNINRGAQVGKREGDKERREMRPRDRKLSPANGEVLYDHYVPTLPSLPPFLPPSLHLFFASHRLPS